jgi:hypothetical protein
MTKTAEKPVTRTTSTLASTYDLSLNWEKSGEYSLANIELLSARTYIVDMSGGEYSMAHGAALNRFWRVLARRASTVAIDCRRD